jgi:uncharacterized protein YmfQ (DUF2313 family)
MPTIITFPLASESSPAQSTPGIVTYSAEAYVRMLKHLLPPGVAFDLESDSDITRTMEAIAQELARVDARGQDLINESDPRTADETIEDWERALGLPDEQFPEIAGTLAERRLAVTARYTARGGSNPEFYQALCAACGWNLISITKYAGEILRCGSTDWDEPRIFRVNDRVYGVKWAYAMTLTLEPGSGTSLAQADLERLIRHVTHSHITVVFEYP